MVSTLAAKKFEIYVCNSQPWEIQVESQSKNINLENIV